MTYTNYRPLLNNETRWSSHRVMIKSYKRIRQYVIPGRFGPDVIIAKPDAREDIEIDELYEMDEAFEEVCMILQRGMIIVLYLKFEGFLKS